MIVAGVAWRRGSRGRVVQGIGLALAPIALYFTGLLRLVWDAVVAVANWATSIIFSPSMWFGISLLGLCVVLWVVGGLLTRRSATKRGSAPAATAGPTGRRHRPTSAPKTPARKRPPRARRPLPEVDRDGRDRGDPQEPRDQLTRLDPGCRGVGRSGPPLARETPSDVG